MGELTSIIDRFRQGLPPRPEPAVIDEAPDGNARSLPALVTDNTETGRTYVTVPVEQAALSRKELTADDFLLRLSGRLVEAERANGNGAFWTTKDLEFGLPSVATGPLNWLHQDRKIIGVLTEADLVQGREAAAENVGPHIRAGATVWAYLYGQEAQVIERAAEMNKLYFSMECVSREVACTGPNGCGAQMPYLDALKRTEKACVHIRERASHRRFVDPIFQGAAIIVPPVKPGWADAHVELMHEAESHMRTVPEAAAFAGEDEALVASILEFVKTGAR